MPKYSPRPAATQWPQSQSPCLGIAPQQSRTLSKTFDSAYELPASVTEFVRVFGYPPLGYRAPQGVLYDGDIDIMKECGFKFSSSVFPSYRVGKFNNLSAPTDPFRYANGIVELPMAVVRRVRLIVSLSYLKLLGMSMFRALLGLFGLPDVVVFDSHLHDYIVHEQSFMQLSRPVRAAYSIRKHSGREYLSGFVALLRAKGYRFITMTELYSHVKEEWS